MSEYGLSDTDRKIICEQICQRAKRREEFLRLRTDPCKNSMEAGHVFDPALQRYIALKTCQYEYFQPNSKNLLFTLASLSPMLIFGYFVWNQRTKFERDCRCGRIKYRDRTHRLS